MEDVFGCLTALAVIGDEVVVDYFKKWEEAPKAWKKKLRSNPLHYALAGDWTVENGEKSSFTLIPAMRWKR